MREHGACRDAPGPGIMLNVGRGEIIVERTVKVEEALPSEAEGAVGYQRLRERIRFKEGLWSNRITRHGVPQPVPPGQDNRAITDQGDRNAGDVTFRQESGNLDSKRRLDRITPYFGMPCHRCTPRRPLAGSDERSSSVPWAS